MVTMLPEIAIALVAGLVLGWLIGWALGQSHTRAEKQRADQLNSDLSQRTAALETAQRDIETARREQAERDKTQSVEIARLSAERNNFERDAEQAANALEEQRAENTRVRNQFLDSETERASLKTALAAEEKNHADKLATLTDQFKALAGDILKENSRTFTEQNQNNLGHLLNPLKEKFDEFQKEVKNLNDSGITGRTELKAQIDNLATLNTNLSEEAKNLVTALKGSSQTQGRWGEQLLESILETAGLRKGHEYLTQESFTRDERAADGRLRAQLDVLVRMPENRNLVIDSKVSLTAYNDSCAAQDDATREAALSRHVASVRGHINELAKRDYHLLDGINSPDFVVMFMPLEPAFMLAIARDSKLWQDAWDKNVLLVSPSTLLFVLRTVAQLWRQELQTKNVEEIKNRGGELYDKLVGFAEDLIEVGSNLGKARSSYDEAVKKLSTGKANAIRQAEMLKNLGAEAKKKLPLRLVQQAMDDESLELAAGEEETDS